MKDTVLIYNTDAQWFADQLKKTCPEFFYLSATTAEQARDKAADAHVLIGLAPQLDDQLLASMPLLKWVHALTTGLDNLLQSNVLSTDVVLSNSNGIHGPQMSELAILLMLSAIRDFPRMLDNQRACHWERWPQPLLLNKTVCVVGLGSIAEDLATRCQALGMHLTGVSDGRMSVPGFSKVYPRRELSSAASEADFLIILVPYDESTHHIIDDAVFDSMTAEAILINLSRGGCVDEEALQQHLRQGSIHHAALDVFAHEPLPPDSTLWDTPGLTITPHIGGMSNIYREQVFPIVIDNLNAWARKGAAGLPNRVERINQT